MKQHTMGGFSRNDIIDTKRTRGFLFLLILPCGRFLLLGNRALHNASTDPFPSDWVLQMKRPTKMENRDRRTLRKANLDSYVGEKAAARHTAMSEDYQSQGHCGANDLRIRKKDSQSRQKTVIILRAVATNIDLHALVFRLISCVNLNIISILLNECRLFYAFPVAVSHVACKTSMFVEIATRTD